MSLVAESKRQNRWVRTPTLQGLLLVSVIALFAKLLASMILQYRDYFPADFSTDFLAGRSGYFYGWYATAFYIHIISGPLAVIAGAVLMLSGTNRHLQKTHQWMGKLQAVLVLGLVLPSGFAMATRAITGVVAGSAFVAHGLATGTCMVLAVRFALNGQLHKHRRWATRCFLLLCAPLLLRFIASITTAMEIQHWIQYETVYQLNAWLSWSIPWLVYEIVVRRNQETESNKTILFNGRGAG